MHGLNIKWEGWGEMKEWWGEMKELWSIYATTAVGFVVAGGSLFIHAVTSFLLLLGTWEKTSVYILEQYTLKTSCE